MKLLSNKLLAVAITLTLSHSHFASAAIKDSAFTQNYQPVATVDQKQAQIVFYREQDSVTDGAHIYVDGELQSSLLSKGYTVFCVSPGSHALSGYIGDAPDYQGKAKQDWRMSVTGGNTYFLKVGNSTTGEPKLRSRAEAEKELKGLRMQKLVLNRASATQQCNYIGNSLKEYSLASDVLFAFGKSGSKDITRNGQQIISELVSKIRQENAEITRIRVIGHTDPIGSVSSNQRLGQRRAETVRSMMIDNGIPAYNTLAESEGSRNLVVKTCSGTKSEKIECYSPNRRVSILVEGKNRQ